MNNLNNQILIKKLSAGDQLAMKEIFHQFFTLVYQKIYRIIRQKELSEDLSQEVFLKLWRKRTELVIHQSLEGYLAMMAYHEAVGHLRNKVRELQTVHSGERTENLSSDSHLEIESKDLQDRIDQVINNLPPRCRSVFLLSRHEGKSYKEIGELMDISVKTVENQMGKALSTLRSSLKDLLTVWIIWLVDIF